MVKQATYVIEQFSHDVRRILDQHGETVEAVWAIGPFMQRLAREGGDLSQAGEPYKGPGLPGRSLYSDPASRFFLLLGRFAPNHATPVHSHEGWGVLCLLSGSDHYTSWRRLDNGSQPGRAQLEVFQDHHLQPGHLAYWFNEPYNIHRQWAGDQGATEIVLFKRGARRLLHFDLEQGLAMDAPPD